MFLLPLYVRQLLHICDYKYRDILDDWDNFVVNSQAKTAWAVKKGAAK